MTIFASQANIHLSKKRHDFLSPAHRGRGILVAPGFCLASSVRLHVFLWAQKLQLNFFLNFNITFLTTWGCESDFLEMLP